MLLDRERDRRSTPATRPDRTDGRTRVVCAACGHHVTDEDCRFAMSGAHEHTFVNPGGFAYVIGCWRAAPGCLEIGAPDSAFSWFPGWSWQIAICGGCRVHLGWCYRNGDDVFFGLIARALRLA